MSGVHLDVSARISENSASRDVQEGLFLLRKGDFEGAQEQFNRALQKDSRNSHFHYLAALCYHLRMLDGESDYRDLAEQGYLYSIGQDPTNWLATYQIALFYQDLRQWGKAKRYWLETLNFRKRDLEVYRNAIYTAYYSRDLPTARRLLSEYEELETESGKYDEIAAVVLAASGEGEAALASLSRLPTRSRDRLSPRIKDWAALHTLAQRRFDDARSRGEDSEDGFDSDGEESYENESWEDEDESGDDEEEEKSRALAVDVVIIRTTEEIGSSRGINILKELQVSLGTESDPGYLDTNTENRTVSRSAFVDSEGNVDFGGTDISFEESDVISRAISIPAINYSLNIANVTGTRNEVLARPTLIAQDGEQSTFFSGSHINAVAVGGSNSDGATESIDVDVGVLLSIGAEFHSDDEFTLAIEAERTFLQEPNTSAVTFPLFVSYSKTRAEATIRMKFGQSLVLSGLSEKETSSLRDGVPFLGDVPILQYLFNRRTTRDFQSSVVLLITPHPPQYVYSDDDGRKPLSALQGTFGAHWQPYPNITQVFQHMESNRLFREFRTGDVRVEKWLSQESFGERLGDVQRFILDLE